MLIPLVSGGQGPTPTHYHISISGKLFDSRGEGHLVALCVIVGDWSLITGKGVGLQNGGRGHKSRVFSLRKGAAKKVLAMLKGDTKRFEAMWGGLPIW